MADISQKPKYSVSLSIEGQKTSLPLLFTLSDAPTKQGINLQFILPDEILKDPRKKQEYVNKISVALQKKLGEAGIPIDYNERNAYQNAASFIVPLSAVATMIMSSLKG